MKTHYEYAKDFLSGKSIEYNMAGIDGAYYMWQPVISLHVFENDGLTFRVKPEEIVTEPYKRYIWKRTDGKYVPFTLLKHDFEMGYNPQTKESFVKFLDEDWITSTVVLEDV